VLLRNDGGNKRTSLRLAFQGLNDNRSAIGTKVEVFAGTLRQKWEVSSSSGYLGQNAPEIVVGMDSAHEADIVRVLWPSGVPQDEVHLAAAHRHLIKEIDREEVRARFCLCGTEAGMSSSPTSSVPAFSGNGFRPASATFPIRPNT
jgi:ASPIC and UnbV.